MHVLRFICKARLEWWCISGTPFHRVFSSKAFDTSLCHSTLGSPSFKSSYLFSSSYQVKRINGGNIGTTARVDGERRSTPTHPLTLRFLLGIPYVVHDFHVLNKLIFCIVWLLSWAKALVAFATITIPRLIYAILSYSMTLTV